MNLKNVLKALCNPLGRSEATKNDKGVRSSAHFLAVVFVLLAAGIVSAGCFYHSHSQKHDLAQTESHLSAISDLKMGELMLWRDERMGDAGFFHHNAAFASMVQNWLRHPGPEKDRRELAIWMDRINQHPNYDGMFLLDAKGKNRLSFPENPAVPLSPLASKMALRSLQSGRITFSDFNREGSTGKIYLSMLVPIFDPAPSGSPIAVLVMRIDPDRFLYPFLKRWPDASATAETLLVRKEGNSVLCLNDARSVKNSALSLRIPFDDRNSPAAMAVSGYTGVVHALGDTGKEKLAVLRRLPDSPWYLVTSIDADEIYAPMRERLWFTLLLMSAMLLAAGTGVRSIWRQQGARFRQDTYEAEQERLELEQRQIKIAANLPGAIFQWQLNLDGSSLLPFVSHGIEELYGVKPEELCQDASPLFAAIHPDDVATVFETLNATGRSFAAWHSEHRVNHPHKGEIWVEANATAETKPDGCVLLHGFIRDITDRKRAEVDIRLNKQRLQCLLNVLQHEVKDNEDLLDSALGEALQMTGSSYGYVYLYDEEKRQFTLNSWSHDVMEACAIVNPATVCQLDETGIWGEAVRQRQPILVNDFSAAHPHKKGCPQGHVALKRFLTIPLLDRGRIVAVVGVANKKAEYGDADVFQLTLLMDAVWKVVQRRKAEDALSLSNESERRAEAIRELNDALELRVKERTVELEASNQELEAFCYAVSHDLSTPLRGICGFSNILQEEYADKLDDDGKAILMRIGKAAGHMGQLIKDLLDLSRVTRSKLNRERLDLSEMADYCIKELSEQEPERQIEVNISEAIEGDGDPVLVRQALGNLLGNAWKYTSKEPCTRIEFGSSMINEEKIYFVRDNGIGFDMAYSDKLFIPFERLQGSGEFKGTGIGLATVQRIITRHGGRVWGESELEKGSTFFFTLG